VAGSALSRPPLRCRLLDFQTIPDERGTLVVVEQGRHIPFRIRSARWASHFSASATVYTEHGEPAQTMVAALSGSFDVAVGSGPVRAPVRLCRADVGLYLPFGHRWSIENPSVGAAWLVLTSAVGIQHLTVPRLESSLVIALPHEERAGWTRVAVSSRREVPFAIRRVYYVHSVAAGAERGGHAHRRLEEVLVAAIGSFDLVLHDGRRSTTVHLDDPTVGVYIPRYSWRELRNFSSGAVCLVLSSSPYDESDYIRDFEDFVRATIDGFGRWDVPVRSNPARGGGIGGSDGHLRNGQNQA
jgi:WxcM-like, C-terminal